MSAEPIPMPTAQMIPLAAIAESPTNPRRRYDPAEEAKLLDSVKAVGVLQPVLVRPHGERFELVFGHRRLRAAKAAELVEIPATVRDLTDLEVLEAQVAENSARADVHPLEEAESYRRLHSEHGRTIDEICAKAGKSRSHVYQRMKLLDLAPKAREAFWDGKIEASVALLVARVPEKLQPQALKACVNWQGDPLSFREARDRIAREFMLRLTDAPWPLDEVELTKAGACTTCPKRTGNQAELFADVDDKDLCTDPVCFKAKGQAHGERALATAKASGARVLTAKEMKEVFPHGPQYGPNAGKLGLVALDETCHEDSKYRTYRKLLGKTTVELVVGKKPDGTVVEFTPKKSLAAALKAAGHDFAAKKSASTSSSRSTSPGSESWRVRQQAVGAIHAEEDRRLLAAAHAKVTAKRDAKSARHLRRIAMRGHVHDALRYGNEADARQLAALFEIEIPDRKKNDRVDPIVPAFVAWIDQASDEQLDALEILVVLCADPPWAAGRPDSVRGAIEKALGIDSKKITAAVKADVRKLAAAAAKAKKAAKKKPAKKAAPTTKANSKSRAKPKPSKPAKKRAVKKDAEPGTCKICGCTEDDCSQCVEKTGEPCTWVDAKRTLCSACEGA